MIRIVMAALTAMLISSSGVPASAAPACIKGCEAPAAANMSVWVKPVARNCREGCTDEEQRRGACQSCD